MKTITIKTICLFAALSMFATFSVQSANAETRSLGDISEISDEVFILGDILNIQGSWCYPSKKPKDATAKQKLQIYIGTSWRNVGVVKFVKSSVCKTKTPYLQIFEWEVDQLGTVIDGRGSLRMRDPSSKPSKYASVYVFDSSSSLEKWQRTRESDASQMMMCLLGEGQWDEVRKICVGGGLGLR